MSNYRDDNQDTAVASDITIVGLRSIAEGIAYLSNTLLFGIAITLSSSALASDEVIDNSIQVLHDSALISEQVIDAKTASQLHTDSAKISERYHHSLSAWQSDSVTANDTLINGTTRSITRDSAQVSDSITSQRVVSQFVTDSARAKDGITAIECDLITDSLSITDNATDKLQAIQIVSDSASATDSAIGSTATLITDSAFAYGGPFTQRHVTSFVADSAAASDSLPFNHTETVLDGAVISDAITDKWIARGVLIDSMTASDKVMDSITQNAVIMDSIAVSDKVVDKLKAGVTVSDGAVIEDMIINIGGHQGQAWTANVDSWAMSRYNPYNYNRLVVINGVLYGEADDGIYRLDEQVSAVTASVKTGKMDLGKGALTHPSTAYLEYELSGGASMTVSTTQKGVEQQYTYMLPNEVADELTNGRFIFGRGLRGRHFAFELIMIGTHGHVNDLSIEHTQTSRRV